MLRQELFDRVDILRKDSPAERIRNMRDLLEEAFTGLPSLLN